jgi:uncharacterized protein YlxW (UPF0749 family)
MKKETSEVSQTFASDELKDSLLQWKEKYEKAIAKQEESSKTLEKVRTVATSKTSETEEKAANLKVNNMLLGTTNVKGNGITITVKDSQSPVATDDISKYLIHDADLRELVNELSNAGAEAIEINGERIVNSTCITCAGNVISINGAKVSSPFIIKAIGNQELLYGALTRPGGYIQLLKDQTISTDVKKTNNLQIQKYDGTLTSKYMKNRGE